MNNAIKSVVNYYHWTPETIDKMYCDDFDYKGIMYWYNEVKSNIPKK